MKQKRWIRQTAVAAALGIVLTGPAAMAGNLGQILGALAGYGSRQKTEFVPDEVHIPNLKIIGAGNNWNMVSRCIRLLEYGLIDTSFMATHFFQLDQYEEALTLTRTRPEGFLKSVFLFD